MLRDILEISYLLIRLPKLTELLLSHVYGCFTCMDVYTLWSGSVGGDQEEGARIPGTGVTNSSEPPRGCWELNLGLLEVQAVLLTLEPSLQTPAVFSETAPVTSFSFLTNLS